MSEQEKLKNKPKIENVSKNFENSLAAFQSNEVHLKIPHSVNNLKDVSLEEVVRDMANVFMNLKDGITLVKSSVKKESFYNLEPELEEIYKNKDEEVRKKEEAKKKAAAEKAAKQKQQQQKKGNNKVTNQNGKNTLNVGSKPNSAPSNINKNQIVVTNLKFPKENKGNAISTSIKGSSHTTQNRPRSSENPSLRKPAQNANVKKVVSVPPSRDIYNPLGILKDEVAKAIREKKTFTIKGQFPAVRRALLNRGWVEKYHASYREKVNNEIKRYQQMAIGELVELLRNKDIAQIVKRTIKSKLLQDNQVDLYWDHAYDAFKECPDNKKLTFINKFRREALSYTSKQGLCQAAREAHWLQIPGVARINHPRCYVLTKGGDTKSFLKDFGLTAAVSLLKWVVKNNITEECKIVSPTGKIPLKVFDFALAECYKYIKKEKHQDIDEEIRDALEIEWTEFLEQYFKAVHIGNHFKLTDTTIHPSAETKNMVRKANYLLNLLAEHMPSIEMDGIMNIWILKPTNSSRGQGIHICRTLQYILDVVKKNPNRRYVVQKYIERPLLIHDTKFDIRQWFLVTSSYPLIIWMYKLCYLRFSSQTYNLRKLHESIHLTNNSVQAKYLQHGSRDPLLPSYGMWDSNQFKNYLSNIGYPTIFNDVIYPGMKQCLTGAMIAHRDKMDKRKNCFELYGADFMIAENFEPWLLEINSNPALHASTPLTAKICPEVLEDVIKVVVDHTRNPRAGTGQFELIYKENATNHTPNKKDKFEITGAPVPEDYFCNVGNEETVPKASQFMPKNFGTPDPGKFLLQTGETMKEALKKLLEIVKREKLKRRSLKEKSIEAKSDEYASQTSSQVISLFQSSISRMSSDQSQILSLLRCEDPLSEDECRKVEEALSDLKQCHNKKEVLSSLVKAVDTLTKAKNANCIKKQCQ